MKKIKYFIILFLLSIPLYPRPQYTMLTGNRCINCHTNYQGGALRNELGIYSRSSFFSLDNRTNEFIDKLTQFSSQFDNKLRYGADFRVQSAKLGSPSQSKRETFIMQATPYLFIKPFQWLEIYGSYNLNPRIYENQSRYITFINFKPDINLPELKIGNIKPSIGNQYDDHTLLIRQIAGPLKATPILPPDYSELGFELSHDYNKIFNTHFGIFKTDNISKIKLNNKSIVNIKSIAKLIRVAFNPRFQSNQINTNFGASYYFSNDFFMTNIFLHLGWTDNLSFISEYLIAENKNLIKINSYFIEFLYHLYESADINFRYEKASSNYSFNTPNITQYQTNQYVFGMNLYILPFIEIRPEFRIYDRQFVEGYHSQWTFQIHFYY